MKYFLTAVVCTGCALVIGSDASPILRVLAGGLWAFTAGMVLFLDKDNG